MKKTKVFIPGRWMISLFVLILLMITGTLDAKATGSYEGQPCDYYHEIHLGQSVTLDVIKHDNQTGSSWFVWRGDEIGGQLEMKRSSLWWSHNINQVGKPLISSTHEIDGIAFFRMNADSATVTGLKPGIVSVNYTVYWYGTHYDTLLKKDVPNEQESEYTVYTVIRVLGNPCILTFEPNGGRGNSYTQSATEDLKMELPANHFTREGYVFTGWNTRADGSGSNYKAGESVTPSGDMAFYAQWKELQLVTFFPNGGVGDMYTQNVIKGEDTPLTANRFSYEGYVLTSWNTSADGSGTAYADKANVRVESDVSLYAQWKRGYIVTFNPNGGTVDSSSFTVLLDEASRDLPAPARSGYTFTGWYSASAGGIKISNTDEDPQITNHSLYAHWAIASGSCGDYLTWTLDDGGVLIISGEGAIGDYKAYNIEDVSALDYFVNPEKVHSDQPWAINRGLRAFYSLIIEDGVTAIGNYAFMYHSELSDISIASSVISIGDW